MWMEGFVVLSDATVQDTQISHDIACTFHVDEKNVSERSLLLGIFLSVWSEFTRSNEGVVRLASAGILLHGGGKTQTAHRESEAAKSTKAHKE